MRAKSILEGIAALLVLTLAVLVDGLSMDYGMGTLALVAAVMLGTAALLVCIAGHIRPRRRRRGCR